MRRAAAAACGVILALATAHAATAAAQDTDVDLIPDAVRSQPATPPAAPAARPPAAARATVHTKIDVEDAFTLPSAPQAVPVPYPSTPYAWQNRTSLDAQVAWQPSQRLTLTLSDRLNVIEQDGQAFASDQTVRNDLREAYVTWEAAPRTYLEAGRINVRNGVALGYNPTDFFKTRSLVGQASLDPSVLRQNRLGTLMARAQAIWDGGSAAVALAPKVAEPSAIVGAGPAGIDPRFDATNAAYRVLSTLSFDVADLSPEVLGYFELHRSKVGLDLSHPIGDAVIAYAEWAGGPEQTLAARALAYGQSTGTLPPGAPVLPPTDPTTAFRNDLSAGFSWTIATTVTVNVEYHFHEAGFTRRNWQDWFALGGAPSASPAVTGALWYVRGYAADQQEPVPMHQVFIRADWPRAFTSDLELSAFAFADLLDGSMLTQLAVSWYASDAWTIAAYGSANVGDARTERGSFPQRFSAIVDVVRYL